MDRKMSFNASVGFTKLLVHTAFEIAWLGNEPLNHTGNQKRSEKKITEINSQPRNILFVYFYSYNEYFVTENHVFGFTCTAFLAVTINNFPTKPFFNLITLHRIKTKFIFKKKKQVLPNCENKTKISWQTGDVIRIKPPQVDFINDSKER